MARHGLARAEALASQAGKEFDAARWGTAEGRISGAADEPDTADVRINADFDKLTRALLNVLTNCIRYADKRVEVRVGRNEPGWVSVAIGDDGPGIAHDDLPHIFDRFYKGRRGVVGLGLAIAQHVVERHGGSITAQNRDKGALFTIRLPVTKAPGGARDGLTRTGT